MSTKIETIAIFDIGKTNKKFLLFDTNINLIHQEETVFEESTDDDGYPCDDIVKLIAWCRSTIERIVLTGEYDIKYLNFSTYGASLVYLDNNNKRITPLYNYLKPMPEGILDGFYEKYGGKEEFSRKTASPALDMLNSGLQILWLKKSNPEYWKQVRNILHLPQYLSYLFTQQITSGYPSIGCHTALWDFDNHKYHSWLQDEGITLPEPVSSSLLYEVSIAGTQIQTGLGIHDSSASLVPYLKAFADQDFILVSTGTWAINMNPFSHDQLTADELKKDCLCYLSVDQKQVKSSRLFLGHIHEVNTDIICKHHGIHSDVFKTMQADESILNSLLEKDELLIFNNGMDEKYMGNLEVIRSFEEPIFAYHQLMYELTRMEAEAISLVFDKSDKTQNIYITGGFVKNSIFCKLLATMLSDKKIFKAELYNATALGAAMIINDQIDIKDINIELEEVTSLKN